MKHRTFLALTLLGSVAGLGFVAAHPAPNTSKPIDDVKYIYPAIENYGKVVQFKDAAQQPRDGSKIVVDITRGDDPDKMNSAIEKVCRFVNIYAGAGAKAAKVEIAVVLHGSATLAVLNSQAYSKRFKVKENPTLEVLKVLRNAGVKVYVCGQSLTSKGATPSEVSDQAEVAVSALTSLVNLQADGYSLLPF